MSKFEEIKQSKIEQLNNEYQAKINYLEHESQEEYLTRNARKIEDYITEGLADDFYAISDDIYGDIFKAMPCHDCYNDFYIDHIRFDTHYRLIDNFYNLVKHACSSFGILSDVLEDKLDKAYDVWYEAYHLDKIDINSEEFDEALDVFNEVVDEINSANSEYQKGEYISDAYQDRYNELINSGEIFELFE